MHLLISGLNIDVNTISERGSAAACDKFNVIAAAHLQSEAGEVQEERRTKYIYIYMSELY